MKKSNQQIYLAYYSNDGERFAIPCSSLEIAKQTLLDLFLESCLEHQLTDSDIKNLTELFISKTSRWNFTENAISGATGIFEHNDFYCWIDLEELR